MKQQLLLLEDVENLGRSGDIVSAKPGMNRNFLLPKKKAVIAGKHTIRLKKRLEEERKKQAEIDRKESLELAQKIKNMTVSIERKVDTQGNLYGSVTASDIEKLLQRENIPLEKKAVQLPRPIKKSGLFEIELRLKENIITSFKLEVLSEEKKEISSLEEEGASEVKDEELPE